MFIDDPAAAVRRMIVALAPALCHGRELGDDLELGAAGLGLDSVAAVELLLACEREFSVAVPETLLDEGPLTIARLVSYIRRARREAPSPVARDS